MWVDVKICRPVRLEVYSEGERTCAQRTAVFVKKRSCELARRDDFLQIPYDQPKADRLSPAKHSKTRSKLSGHCIKNPVDFARIAGTGGTQVSGH